MNSFSNEHIKLVFRYINSLVGRRYVQWSERDTKIVKRHFKEYIQDVSLEGSKGSLPGMLISFI